MNATHLRIDLPLDLNYTSNKMSKPFSQTFTPNQIISPVGALSGPEEEEERIVAELELLGIRYLSRRTTIKASKVRSPSTLLADLVHQPSARVRAAVIAVLLAHPEYATAIPEALEALETAERR